MSRLVIYIPEEDGIPPEVEANLYRSFNGALPVITTHIAPVTAKPPKTGHRPLRESAYLAEEGRPKPERPTHSRFGPWVITGFEKYPCDLPGPRFDEVLICTCTYSPLPEAENPWVPVKRLQPTVESFGGDEAAFKAWQEEQGDRTGEAVEVK